MTGTHTTTEVLGVPQHRPSTVLPAGSCDCHVHVFGPVGDYPYAADRSYTPGDARVTDLLTLHRILGIDRLVLVQPSVYGPDDSLLRHGLRELGPRARGVTVLGGPDSETGGENALWRLHRAGVRGVRVNLASAGQRSPDAALRTLRRTAARIAPLPWHVQLYGYPDTIHALRAELAAFPVPVVIDHFGLTRLGRPEFASLVWLLEQGNTYVKLSAPYRISERPDFADSAPTARAMVAANPERLLWGSDWPHTGQREREPGHRDIIEPFRPIDDGAAVDAWVAWAGTPEVLRTVLVDNPATLYGF